MRMIRRYFRSIRILISIIRIAYENIQTKNRNKKHCPDGIHRYHRQSS
jgi:hypothetical protein